MGKQIGRIIIISTVYLFLSLLFLTLVFFKLVPFHGYVFLIFIPLSIVLSIVPLMLIIRP